MNIINAVVAELVRRGYPTTNEYPGCVVITFRHCSFWTSDQNDTWTVDICSVEHGENIHTWDTKVKRTETDITLIADAISMIIGPPRIP